MTDLVNPYEEILSRDPTILTPPEAKEYEELTNKRYPTLTQVAVGLTAAWVFYRKVIRRRLLEELAKNPEPDISKMRAILSILYHAYLPSWLGVATPAAVSGYRIGAAEAAAGEVPDEYLQDIAGGYVRQLGDHLNDVSTQAVLEGFQAQLNRKHPAGRAAKQVANAYGVPPRAMNTLVSVWNAEDPKKLVNKPVENFKESRATRIIDKALHTRDLQIGDAESWAAKNAAKQVVWMYKQQQGVIPWDAKRTWVTARDEKVCPHCGPLHRKSAPVGKKFAGGVWTPPLHVNCRCDIILDFRPNDIDEELSQLFEYEEVGKAAYKDKYDRDSHGRFAPTESRKGRPSKTATLWGQVNVPSMVEDLQRQLEEVNKPAPGPIKPIPSLKAIPSAAIPSRAIPSGAIPNAKPFSGEKIKQAEISLPTRLPLLVPSRLKKIQSTFYSEIPSFVDAVLDTPPENPEDIPFGWEPAEFPIAFLIEPEEYSETGTQLLSAGDIGVRLGKDRGEHGGYRALMEKVSDYWNETIPVIYKKLMADDAETGFTHEGHYYEVNEDTVDDAIAESIAGIYDFESDSKTLYDENYQPRPFTLYEIAQKLGVDTEVAKYRPYVLVTRHVSVDAEALANGFTNPGKFQTDLNAKDFLAVEGAAHMPVRVRYAKPID